MKQTCRVFFAILLLTCVFTNTASGKYVSANGLSGKILRLHVVAHSDSPADQELKLLVKDSVVKYMQTLTADCADIDEVKSTVTAHRTDIETLALQTLLENNDASPVTVSIGTMYFPQKVYGDLTFPEGDYEALKIQIGDGLGKNWWCVLYPPLCFVDVSTGIVPESSKKELVSSIGEKAYEELLHARDAKTLKIKSKIWESLQKLLPIQ